MPTPSFSKDVTSIFNSNELSDELKYDVTCKLVCESLQLTSVSMLIYDAQLDQLRCKGCYLAPQQRSKYVINGKPELELVIEHISVFEYFETIGPSVKNLSITTLKDSVVIGETNKNYAISEEKFDDLKRGWISGVYRAVYTYYKEAIHKENHAISNSTVSGSYFSRLLTYGKKLTSEIEFLLLRQGPQKGESFFAKWRSLDVSIPSDHLYYIGLPLFANERYTGIIRLTAFSYQRSSIEDLFKVNEASLRDFQNERLNNFAQIISLHLKTNYYLEGFRTLSNLKVDEHNKLRTGKENFDDVCTTLTSVIRCNGCIIRFTTRKTEGKNPPIKGISDSLRTYLGYTNENASSAFSEDIYGLLKPTGKSTRAIKAINFSISEEDDSDTFETVEYFYNEEERLNSENQSGRRFRDFTPEYLAKLRSLNMREIVVLGLEFIEYGFLIITNTANRKFTTADIEMILLASKRIGLEIKHLQDTERINEQNKIIAQEEHALLIVHQIGAPARALSGFAQNLDDKIFKEHETPLKISQMNRMAFALLRQINTLQRYLDWETKPINPKKDQRYSIESYIRSRAIQFEGLTVGTKLRIWTIIENKDSFVDDCSLDKIMLDEVLNCLLDNAVKYSFSQYEMFRRGVAFDPTDPNSEGHIHIRVNSSKTHLTFSVENYGSAIESKEFERIFDRGTRGKYGKKKSPVGSGIGLYLAKKVVAALGGRIEVFHDRIQFKTSFKITLTT